MAPRLLHGVAAGLALAAPDEQETCWQMRLVYAGFLFGPFLFERLNWSFIFDVLFGFVLSGFFDVKRAKFLYLYAWLRVSPRRPGLFRILSFPLRICLFKAKIEGYLTKGTRLLINKHARNCYLHARSL